MAIEEIAVQNGHEIVLKINIHNLEDFTTENLQKADVAIEFTGPESAADNLLKCFLAGVPVVCGSTGWLDRWKEVEEFCYQAKAALVYASNYSIGVNLFFELNSFLAKLMNDYDSYNVEMEEIHHTQKKDAPSGTAITIAEQILSLVNRKKQWTNNPSQQSEDLPIVSKRIDPAPGTHIVKYTSAIDDIEIIHTAHSRTGFAAGAVKAAEYVADKIGVFSMKDVLAL